MVRSECAFQHLQGVFVEFLRLVVFAFVEKDQSQRLQIDR